LHGAGADAGIAHTLDTGELIGVGRAGPRHLDERSPAGLLSGGGYLLERLR
jgi:hypothetical protein